ncbi:uncharacterized protein LOC115597477 [Sparus aurata]|uniref:uncharacterized protein LOC115597477 n=1 Tax=Sparus aurata TaxID=8175 RepID=UPI0011C1C7A9|nr:uncharacterized protein LOC115597477 [Sparus aurata]
MKANKGEINYLPNFPDGFDQAALEGACKDLVDEMQKRTPNGPLVFMEFSRIVGKNLKQEFYESINRYLTCGTVFNSQRTTKPTAIRTQVLRGLPIILGDNPTNFFKASFESDDDDSFHNIDIGILFIECEGAVLTSSKHLSPALLKIIIEGEVVMDNIQDLPKAMCILFGLTYALHINYPKTMKLTFQFIQQEAFCAKAMNFSHVMDLVTKVTNLIRGGNRSLNHRKFVSFLDEVSAAYGDLQMHTDIRWMSRGKRLERFFELCTEIPVFLEESIRCDASTYCSKLRDTDFLCDMTLLHISIP